MTRVRWRDAARGVGGLVVKTEIGLHLDNGGSPPAGLKDFAKQIAGHGDGVAGVERFGQNQVGSRGTQWVD
jgi:hypothetical protein